MTPSISLIGAGHLGSALVRGLIKTGYPKKLITVSNLNRKKLDHLIQESGVVPALSNVNAVDNADVLILAIKPQFMHEVCLEIASTVQKKQPLIISLVGVIEMSTIMGWLDCKNLPVIRVMTNTPIEFCTGTSALFANDFVTAEQRLIGEKIFKSLGSLIWLDKEELLDPLTAAIGSAPAYVLLFMEALQKAAMSQKIPEHMAQQITVDVLAGTAELAKNSGRSFANLRAGVTTPNGITEYSLQKISIDAFLNNFQQIYQAAIERIEQIKN